jgi:hypothetical protein
MGIVELLIMQMCTPKNLEGQFRGKGPFNQ